MGEQVLTDANREQERWGKERGKGSEEEEGEERMEEEAPKCPSMARNTWSQFLVASSKKLRHAKFLTASPRECIERQP